MMVTRRAALINLMIRLAVVPLACLLAGPLRAAEDPLENVWTTTADDVRQSILKTADLPGGQDVRQLAEAPVVLWTDRCFLGTDNAYSNEDTRYCVIRLLVANRTSKEVRISREKISVRAGTKTLPLGSRSALLRDIPLEIDWHTDGNVRPQSQLRTPRQIKVAPDKAVAFWVVVAGIDPVPAIPPVTVTVETEEGGHYELNVSSQQNARLGLSTQKLGPRNSVTVLSIHGQLNRLNSVLLADQINDAFTHGCRRVVVDWAPGSHPSDEVLFGWLVAAGNPTEQSNPLHLQLPMLPQLRQLLLSRLPKENEEVMEWEDAANIVFENPQQATVSALREIFESVPAQVLLQEMRSGHPWSREAALQNAGNRLPADALPALLQLSRSQDPDQQSAAILALGAQPQLAAAQRLHELARDPALAVSRAALTALLANPSADHRELILKLLADPGGLPIPADQLLQLLADYYHPDWNSVVVESVSSPNPAVRRVALEVLHRVGHPQLQTFCRKALSDNDERVREQAFQILIGNRDQASEQAAREYALQRLNEGHIDDSILEFVEKVRETQAAPALLAEIQKPGRPRGRLIEVIGQIGTNEHLLQTLQGLESFNEDERVAVLELIGQLSLETQLNVIRQVQHSDSPQVRYAVLELLKALANDPALAILAEMLQDDTQDDHGMICMALGEIGTAAAVQLLREFQARAAAENSDDDLNAAQQGLNLWRSRLPGFSFVEAGYVHLASDDDEEAIKAFTMAILINPDLADAYSSRGNIYLRKAQFEQARSDFARAMELNPYDGQAITGVAIVRAIDGDATGAIQLVSQHNGRFRRDRFFAYNTACVYSRCVESLKKQPAAADRDQQISDYNDQALARLKESIKLGFDQLDWMQKDPDLAAIRDLPEFHKLLQSED